MLENVVIFGAGNTGKSAYFYLKAQVNIVSFVDSDQNKWGKFEGIPIQSPDLLTKMNDVKVIIASSYWEEILEKLKE